MNAIAHALSNGLGYAQVLALMSHAMPKFKNLIEKARGQGHTDDQIVAALSKDYANIANTKKARNVGEQYSKNASGAQKARIKELRSKREQNLLQTLGIAAGAVGTAALAAPALIGKSVPPNVGQQAAGLAQGLTQGNQNPVAQVLTQAAPAASQSPLMSNPMQQNPLALNSFQPTGIPLNQPQAQNAIPAATPILSAELFQNASQALEQAGILSNVKNFAKQKLTPDQIKTAVEFIVGKDKRKNLLKQGIDLDKAIDDFVTNFVPSAQDIPTEISDQKRMVPGANEAPIGMPTPEMPMDENAKTRTQVPNFHGTPLPESLNSGDHASELQGTSQEIAPANEGLEEQEPEESREATQGATVMLPNGEIGKITGEEGRKAFVDVDGVKRFIPKKDAYVFSPSEVKRLDQSVAQILEILPESEMSTALLDFTPLGDGKVVVQMASNPDIKYVYENVEDDLVAEVLSAQNVAKTTGENVYGKHTAGVGDSRGNAFTKIRTNPKKYPVTKIDAGHNNMHNILRLLSGQISERNASDSFIKKEAKAAEKAAKSASNLPKKPRKPKK